MPVVSNNYIISRKNGRISINYILHFVVVFLLLFDVRIPGGPNGIGASLPLLIIFIIVLFVRRNLTFDEVWNDLSPLFIAHFIILIYVVFRVLIDGDPQIFLAVAKSLVLFLAFFFYWKIYAGQAERLPLLVLNAFFINAIISFVAGSNPVLLGFVKYFQFDPLTTENMIAYRNAFISGSGFFAIGSAYGLAAVFLTFHFILENRKNYILPALKLLLIFVAGFIAARTSLLALILVGIQLFLLNPKRFIVVVAGFVVFVYALMQTPQLVDYNEWLFEFLNGSSTTTDVLINDMYFWPEWNTLLFGDGNHNVGGGYYGGTDAGYMRNILFGGLPYLLLLLSFVVLMFIRLRRVNLLFALCVILLILGFHAKGAFIYNNAQGMAVFYLIYAYYSLRGFKLSS